MDWKVQKKEEVLQALESTGTDLFVSYAQAMITWAWPAIELKDSQNGTFIDKKFLMAMLELECLRKLAHELEGSEAGIGLKIYLTHLPKYKQTGEIHEHARTHHGYLTMQVESALAVLEDNKA